MWGGGGWRWLMIVSRCVLRCQTVLTARLLFQRVRLLTQTGRRHTHAKIRGNHEFLQLLFKSGMAKAQWKRRRATAWRTWPKELPQPFSLTTTPNSYTILPSHWHLWPTNGHTVASFHFKCWYHIRFTYVETFYLCWWKHASTNLNEIIKARRLIILVGHLVRLGGIRNGHKIW